MQDVFFPISITTFLVIILAKQKICLPIRSKGLDISLACIIKKIFRIHFNNIEGHFYIFQISTIVIKFLLMASLIKKLITLIFKEYFDLDHAQLIKNI